MSKPKVHYISGEFCTGRYWQKFVNTADPDGVTCKRCLYVVRVLRQRSQAPDHSRQVPRGG